jgi:hypothetical protein
VEEVWTEDVERESAGAEGGVGAELDEEDEGSVIEGEECEVGRR